MPDGSAFCWAGASAFVSLLGSFSDVLATEGSVARGGGKEARGSRIVRHAKASNGSMVKATTRMTQPNPRRL